MDLLTLLGKFENSNWTRETVNTNNGETVSYANNTNVTITVNSDTTITNIYRTCITHDETNIYLYIHHSKKGHLTKFKLSEITSLVIT